MALLEGVEGGEALRGKAIFRASRACHGLRRYGEAKAWLMKMVEEGVGGDTVEVEMRRVEARLAEASGEVDFEGMIEELEKRKEMDRASWVGGVEKRESKDMGGGRGLFVTRALKAGEVVAVEKAFAAVLPPSSDDRQEVDEDNKRTRDGLRALRAAFADKVANKLEKNPSLVAEFAQLYAGEQEEQQSKVEEIDDAFVKSRCLLNSFDYFASQKDAHWNAIKKPEQELPVAESKDGCMGVWITASLINHSCLPNVQQSVCGDMIILRATRDLAKDTELRLNYCGTTENVEDREEHLKQYGFVCSCPLCRCQRDTTPAMHKARSEAYKRIIERFESDEPTDMATYFALLTTLSKTFDTDPAEEPRRILINPAINLISACSDTPAADSSLKEYVIKVGLLLLKGLGWDLKTNASKFQVKRYGLVTDEVVAVLADMWTAYGVTCPSIVKEVEGVLRTAYCIMVGEEATFESVYGACRPGGELEEGEGGLVGGEDMMELVRGMRETMATGSGNDGTA